jgi:hypothetical protein
MRLRRGLRRGLLLFVFFALLPGSVALQAEEAPSHTNATTVTTTLYASKDNTLYEDAGGALSNGAGESFFAGSTGAGNIRRGVLAFDVAGHVVPGSTIISAALTLQMSRTTAGAEPVALHRLSAGWGEGASVAPGEGGGGGAAMPGDATWLHTFFDTGFWTTPGGDFAPAASATITVDGLGAYTWEGLQADVQSWLDDPGGNHGWILLGNEGESSTSKRFNSKEHGDAGTWPRLTIRYEPVSAVHLPVVLRE